MCSAGAGVILTGDANEFYIRYREQLKRDGVMSLELFSLVFPCHQIDDQGRYWNGSGLLWHMFNGPFDQLLWKDTGELCLLRNTVYGSKRLAPLGSSKPPQTVNQNIRTNVKGLPPLPLKVRPEVKDIYAGCTLMGAWLHAITKPLVDGTLLLVGFGPTCAAYKHFKDCKIKGCVYQRECDVLLLDAKGDPGPGILVAEATNCAMDIRVLHNTLDR